MELPPEAEVEIESWSKQTWEQRLCSGGEEAAEEEGEQKRPKMGDDMKAILASVNERLGKLHEVKEQLGSMGYDIKQNKRDIRKKF